MTKYKNILRNKEFDEKIGSLKLNISEKLKEHKYELKNLENVRVNEEGKGCQSWVDEQIDEFAENSPSSCWVGP